MDSPHSKTNASALETPPEILYLNDLSDGDRELGFRHRRIACPTIEMPLRRVKAVVFAIDASNRIVRVFDGVFNRPGYVHQCFGVLKKRRSARGWYPVQLTFPDAVMALNSWQNGKDNREFGDGTFTYVEAELPTQAEY
ncbi:MAG: hypothetical protein JNL18_22020 [Planctomycetaceae bacterium]|uniref:Uncharacterized protein n=1 Tax=Lacipirellula limnantheis TaxID=2528024 RepID=A0A517U2G0_9BACT|nr:hypothetical protein [Lacipirellula limnantheis]MBL9165420.1 hypothetical protein [Planctomycetaceae bacterium]QDT74811.1 hypothetical protein I41_40140 [Lacipirellula limnantheis]